MHGEFFDFDVVGVRTDGGEIALIQNIGQAFEVNGRVGQVFAAHVEHALDAFGKRHGAVARLAQRRSNNGFHGHGIHGHAFDRKLRDTTANTKNHLVLFIGGSIAMQFLDLGTYFSHIYILPPIGDLADALPKKA